MSSPLRIAIVGGGNIGSSLALKFVTVGKHDVTVVARPSSKRLAQLRNHGIVTTQGESCKVAVADTLDVTVRYDLVIITTTGIQAEPLLPLLKQSAAKIILFMFNIYDPERLRDMFGERAAFGFPFIQAMLNDDGLLQASYSMKSSLGDQRCVDIFTSSAIPAALEPKMLLWSRSHTSLAIAMLGATWHESRTVATGMYASLALTTSMGYQLYPAPLKVINWLPTPIVTGLLWLFSRMKEVRDQLGTATSVSECHAVIDTVVATAQQANKLSVISALQAIKSL
ncbi:hypothetical protein BKA62DRAFT_805782 [Auriculariales sp. MPI-PUGE-AT-0066]|nr:hypothetical protein BKA62DRAFT_805782 [Auriculariales sp. MPI-PUGE-AT-0066]